MQLYRVKLRNSTVPFVAISDTPRRALEDVTNYVETLLADLSYKEPLKLIEESIRTKKVQNKREIDFKVISRVVGLNEVAFSQLIKETPLLSKHVKDNNL